MFKSWQVDSEATMCRRIGQLLFPLCIILLSPLSADTIYFTNAKEETAAAVWRYAGEQFHVLLPDGKRQAISVSGVEKIEFAEPSHIASITTSEEKNLLASVSSFQKGMFHVKDIKGDTKEIPAAKTKEALFYPVSKLARKLDVPVIIQKPDYCGEACVEMATAFLGKRVSQDRVNEIAGLDGSRGVYGRELALAVQQLGLKTAERRSWPGRSEEHFLLDRMRLLECIERGHPALLGVWADHKEKQNADIWSFDHFVLLIGYDLQKQCFCINDPAQGYWEVAFDEFIEHRRTSSGNVWSIEFVVDPAHR